ncbi:MAG: cobyrinate a,c-diamide synthase [Alphaproteobacteria bacterium]|nr:cobyrinate a,c-diamide synthase [Alphaproteobacteria bacterium]
MTVSNRARGVIIGAARSGAGKTTVTLGLLRALARTGLAVQPFKCGPDYIDPAFHAVAAGRPSYTLDCWAMSRPSLAHVAWDHAASADLSIVEGVMGLFDGAPRVGQAGNGSTADLAALLGWPVVLVLDVAGQAETAAAVAAGCARYRDDVAVAGVILNRVRSQRHLASITTGLDRIGIPLFGALLVDEAIGLPERHLGLVQAGEIADLDRRLDALAGRIEAAVDLGAVQGVARPLVLPAAAARLPPPPGQRIALAQDAGFSFLYPHLLEAWRAAGAEIRVFSPLADEPPAGDADVVWLPGGYPELHAGTLASAHRFQAGLRASAARSVPIHGECGGYMVLGNGIEDAQGVHHAMVGLLTLETSFAKRQLHLGYRRARLVADCPLGTAGSEILGHEFHYAAVLANRDEPLVQCCDAAGSAVAEGGGRRGSASGTFFHYIDRQQ